MAFWIWKTSTKVSHCSMSKERISCVNDCICSALFGFVVVEDASTSAIWLSSDTPDFFTGPRTINNTMLSALFFSTSRLEVTYVKQVIDCHPKIVPLCLPERRSKEVHQTDVLPSLDLLWSRTRRERYFLPNVKTGLDESWRERNWSVDLEKGSKRDSSIKRDSRLTLIRCVRIFQASMNAYDLFRCLFTIGGHFLDLNGFRDLLSRTLTSSQDILRQSGCVLKRQLCL